MAALLVPKRAPAISDVDLSGDGATLVKRIRACPKISFSGATGHGGPVSPQQVLVAGGYIAAYLCRRFHEDVPTPIPEFSLADVCLDRACGINEAMKYATAEPGRWPLKRALTEFVLHFVLARPFRVSALIAMLKEFSKREELKLPVSTSARETGIATKKPADSIKERLNHEATLKPILIGRMGSVPSRLLRMPLPILLDLPRKI